jgi:hypothetical protein
MAGREQGLVRCSSPVIPTRGVTSLSHQYDSMELQRCTRTVEEPPHIMAEGQKWLEDNTVEVVDAIERALNPMDAVAKITIPHHMCTSTIKIEKYIKRGHILALVVLHQWRGEVTSQSRFADPSYSFNIQNGS